MGGEEGIDGTERRGLVRAIGVEIGSGGGAAYPDGRWPAAGETRIGIAGLGKLPVIQRRWRWPIKRLRWTPAIGSVASHFLGISNIYMFSCCRTYKEEDRIPVW